MEHDTPFSSVLPVVSEPSRAITTLLERSLEAISQENVPCKRTRGRPKAVSDHFFVLAVFTCILHGFGSQWDIWRRIACFGVGPFVACPISDQAIYKRIAEQGVSLMQQVCARICDWLAALMVRYEDRSLAPWATGVFALDESTQGKRGRFLAHLFGRASNDEILLGGKMCALMDLRRQCWREVLLLPPELAQDQQHCKPLVQRLPFGSLLLFDLGFFSFEWLDQLSQQGIWWISRIRHNTSYSIEHVLISRDGYFEALVFLGTHRSDRMAHLSRLVRVRYRGQWYSWVTNQRNMSLLSGAQIVQLYARRWDIELGFRMLKDHLQLRLLWGAKPQAIAMQVWASVALAQLYHALQVQCAAEVGVGTFDVSLDLLLRSLPSLMQKAAQCGQSLRELLLREGRQIGIVRASTRRVMEVPIYGWKEYATPPPDLVAVRTPHYAHKVGRKKKPQGAADAAQQTAAPN